MSIRVLTTVARTKEKTTLRSIHANGIVSDTNTRWPTTDLSSVKSVCHTLSDGAALTVPPAVRRLQDRRSQQGRRKLLRRERRHKGDGGSVRPSADANLRVLRSREAKMRLQGMPASRPCFCCNPHLLQTTPFGAATAPSRWTAEEEDRDARALRVHSYHCVDGSA